MTTHRYEQSHLNQIATWDAHPFQKEVLEYFLAKGWQVKTRASMHGAVVITITHKDGAFGMIAPNGLFQRPSVGKRKVEWNWNNMAELAKATVPAPHVLTARAAKQAA